MNPLHRLPLGLATWLCQSLVWTSLYLQLPNANGQGTATANSECLVLSRAVLSMAVELLRAYGEFTPYGAGLTSSKEVANVPQRTDARHHENDDRLASLRNTLAKAMRERRLQATALVYEVKTDLQPEGPRSDPIAVSLSHRDGYSALHIFPYELRDGQVHIGAMQTIEPKTPAQKAGARWRR